MGETELQYVLKLPVDQDTNTVIINGVKMSCGEYRQLKGEIKERRIIYNVNEAQKDKT